MKKTTLFAACTVMMALAGCDSLGLRGDASMRVEVEVYSGPLSKDTDTQHAELVAMLQVANVGLRRMERDARLSQCRLGCFGGGTMPHRRTDLRKLATGAVLADTTTSNPKSDGFKRGDFDYDEGHVLLTPDTCDAIMNVTDYIETSINTAVAVSPAPPTGIRRNNYFFATKFEDRHLQICPTLLDVEYLSKKKQADVLSVYMTGTSQKFKLDREDIRKAAEIGSFFTNVALLLTAEEIRVTSGSIRARTELAQFAHATAEMGKSLSNRADALLRQLDSGPTDIGKPRIGTDRRLLPSNLYLTTATPTEFSYLHNWLETGAIRGLSNEERTKALQRLINDTFWSKINTVYAYGRGTVRMAFIKDDIGNWDLKSFDSNPAELLDAYRNVGLAALKGAARIAQRTATGGADLSGFAENAQKFAMGTGSNSVANRNYQTLRTHTGNQLAALQTRFKERFEKLSKQIDEARTAVEKLDEEIAVLNNGEADKKRAIDDAEVVYREVFSMDEPDNEAVQVARTNWMTAVESLTLHKAEEKQKKGQRAEKTAVLTLSAGARDELPGELQRSALAILAQYKSTLESLQAQVVKN